MKNLTKLTLGVFALGVAACTQAGAADEMDRKQIEAVIQEYLMENPEIIRDALIALNEKDEREALEAVQDDIYKDKRDPVVGPDNAKVTIVEFFDYNCGFCKRSTEWLQAKMSEYPNDVRVIFKELPLLDGRTKTSKNAAKAALAAAKQDKYFEMHVALMTERSLTADRITAIAKKVGLDMDRFEKDMASPAFAAHIEDNIELASAIPMFGGTPFFLINGEHLSGANTERMQELFDKAMGS